MMKLTTVAAIIGVALIPSPYAFSNHNTPQALEARVSAVGSLNVSDEASASSSEEAGPVDGESVYTANCNTCHGAGIAGAPILGDINDWEDRLEQGLENLIIHALEGFTGSVGVMPAKGGNASLSDDAVRVAVEYMVDQVE